MFFSGCHLTTQLCLLRYANDSAEERRPLAALREEKKAGAANAEAFSLPSAAAAAADAGSPGRAQQYRRRFGWGQIDLKAPQNT